MDSKEVKVRVEAGKDGVFGTVLGQIGRCWGEEMRPSKWLDGLSKNLLEGAEVI